MVPAIIDCKSSPSLVPDYPPTTMYRVSLMLLTLGLCLVLAQGEITATRLRYGELPLLTPEMHISSMKPIYLSLDYGVGGHFGKSLPDISSIYCGIQTCYT